MSTYVVEISRAAEKSLLKLPKGDQEKLVKALEGLEKDPFIGNKLQEPLKGLWSLRVWPYRIVYSINKDIITVTVVAIGHRKDIYRQVK